MPRKATKQAKQADKATEVTIRALKGFDADMRCYGGFQYEFGKTYEQPVAEVCASGFHACDGSPFDVWGYFGPVGDDGRLNRFAEVICSGDISRKSDDSDSKFASTKITVEAEVRLPDFIKRAIAWVIDATRGKGDDPSGDYAKIGSSGHSAKIGSSGDYAQIGSSGNSARIGSSGNSAQIDASGKDAVVASAGPGTRVKGSRGTWISVAEFNDDGKCIGFATGCIGHDGLTPDTFYVAKGGKLVAA